MLEVLDPEQNSTFVDHYLEVEYDLSNVMFLTTANSYNMPGPLLDRMEIIPLAGYTEDEKAEIARQHLIPKQIKAHGLKKGEVSITDGALSDVIRYYTREAGVRSLEREIAKLARKAVTELIKSKGAIKSIEIDSDKVAQYLGVKRHRYGLAEKEDQVGVVTGLAWTSVGGDLLQIEALRLPGKGRMKTTGKLGDVMKESVEAARTVVRARARQWGIADQAFEKRDLHIHFPEGATPKDGPSAGAAITTAMVSALTGIPVRADVAMTGEITLRGEVLEIGGLKEKLLAAHRGGIKTVMIPEENVKDLAEIPDNVKNHLEIIPVRWIDRVLEVALQRMPVPLSDEEVARLAAEAVAAAKSSEAGSGGVMKH
jgi:ATP-dependent Lon protease